MNKVAHSPPKASVLTGVLTVPSVTFSKHLTENEVASILEVSPRTLQRWRYEGHGPSFFREGKVVRYPADKLHDYIESKVVHNDCS